MYGFKMNKNAGDNMIFERYRNLSDESWFKLNTDEYETNKSLQEELPGFPPTEIQMRFNGKSGKINLLHAFTFYVYIKKMIQQHVPNSTGDLLDFGCGWGRILRFWLKEFPDEKIWGCDVMQISMNLCKEFFDGKTGIHFLRNEVLPPLDIPDSKMRVIYAHSVFSHLSQSVADEWIKEFHRLLEVKGLLVITTRPKNFIQNIIKKNGCSQGNTEWKKRYDKGEFCFQPGADRDELKAKYYGHASFSTKYVRKNWNQFDVVEFLPANTIKYLPQDIFVLQKREGVHQQRFFLGELWNRWKNKKKNKKG